MPRPAPNDVRNVFPDFDIKEVGRQDFVDFTSTVYRIECKTCFRSSNWMRAWAFVADSRGVRKWVADHEHQLTLDQMLTQVIIAHPKNERAKHKLGGYCRLAGWVRQGQAPQLSKLLEFHSGSTDPGQQAMTLADAISGKPLTDD